MRALMTRGHQEEYPTQFRICLGCSVVFIEPELFAAASTVRSLYSQEPTMAHEISSERQAIERRFWQARAKRLNGGSKLEPPSSEVAQLMRRGRLDEK
jgi:hypothetical protein